MEGIRKWWAAVGILLTLLEVQITRCDPQQTDKRKPNFVVFYADDLGWADLASYGHPSQEFGPIDRMAMEGTRFTQWYSPDTLCTPSRTSLLTGTHIYSSIYPFYIWSMHVYIHIYIHTHISTLVCPWARQFIPYCLILPSCEMGT